MKLTKEQTKLASLCTELQKNFVLHLVKPGMTQGNALKLAGSKCRTKVARENAGCVMFKNPQVRAFYDSIIESAIGDAVMSREEALERLTRSSRVTITDVCDFKNVCIGEDEDGDPVYQTVWTMKNSEDIPEHIAVCIKSVSITKSGPKLELYDSNASIKQLSDMQGWNAPKQTELTGKNGKPLSIKADIKSPDVAKALAELMGKL